LFLHNQRRLALLLLDGYALGEVARLIDVGAFKNGDMIGEQL
jgi:hypothetical protein